MAYRTWGRVLLAALLVGIVSGAGQLGIAYGLGLVRFDRSFDAATANQWPAQLVWVGWFAMLAAVLGAMVADRLVRRYTLPTTLGNRAAISALAALGALAVAPLSMQPARAAQVASADPVALTGVAAAVGAGVGFVAALAALSHRPVLWNIGAVTGVVWFLAVLSVLPSLGPADPMPAVRLGGVDPSWLGAGASQRLAVVTMPALALVAGALAGALARRRELPSPVVASCGVAGPAMLALAYVVAGRGDSTDAHQAAPYWAALIAVGAGALGSVLAAWARWPLTAPAETAPADSTAESAPSSVSTTPGGTAATTAGVTVGAVPGSTAGMVPVGGGTAATTAGSDASDAPTAVIPPVSAPSGGATTDSTWPGSISTGNATTGATTIGNATVGSTATGSISTGSISTGRAALGGATTGGASADSTWRLDIPGGAPPAGGTGTGGDRVAGTTAAGTWTPGPAAGGQPGNESTEPPRAPAPDTGNWSFDLTGGIPTPRVSTEYSAPTERFGSPTPTTPESGQRSSTEPVSPASDGPTTGSGDAGSPAGWAGARRLRTEDFWPTTTPTETPAGSAATTPAAPEQPAAATPPAVPMPPAVPAPPAVSTPPGVPAPPGVAAPPAVRTPPVAMPTAPPATATRTDDAWDAFAPVSRPRLDPREPSTDPAQRPTGGSGAGTTSTGTSSPGTSSPGSPGSSGSSGSSGPGSDDAGRAGDKRSYPSGNSAEWGRSRTEPSGADPTRTERIPPVPVVSGDSPVQATSDRGTPPAETDPASTAEVRSESGTGDPEPPTGRIRRGLFRRNRGSTDPEQTGTIETGKSQSKQENGQSKQEKGEPKQDKGEAKQREAKGRTRTEEPVPARDEEYVDWVSGLSEPDPAADDLGPDRSLRRSLRSTGRHHAD
ncbi:hypothetical protein [Plantactinospora mayteni]|nr:hypothetical protein [Plantactinospora mayteni]